MKKKLTFLLLILPLYSIFSQSGIRDIVTLDSKFYSNDTFAVELEEVLLVPLSNSLIGDVKIQATFTDFWQRYLLQAGVVYIWKDGLYSELVYGPAFDQRGVLSHEGFAETTYETENYLLSTRFKMGFYPEVDSFFIAPDISGAFSFNPFYRVRGKYFFGWDSTQQISHSLQLENRFTWNETVTTDFIVTGSISTENAVTSFPYEVGAKGNFTINKNWKIRYLVNFIKPDDQIWCLQNGITFDLLF